MSDYISRTEAIAAAFSANGIGNSEYRDVCDIAERLRKIHAADVVPMGFHERCLQEEIKKRLALERKHGKWRTALLDHESFGVRPKVLYCSECKQAIAFPTNFCPNCGASMRGDDDV